MKRLIASFAAAAVLGLTAGCDQASQDTGASPGGENSTSGQAAGEVTDQPDTSEQRAPDNTGINERDRSENALTPIDQGGSEADRELTRQLRKVVTQDQFSTDAKNIKIITINGKATLRGPVKDAQERQAIESAVKAIPGVTSVDNQLEPKEQANQ